MSTQHAQYVLLSLVLMVNSNRSQILQSYTLLLKPPIIYTLLLITIPKWEVGATPYQHALTRLVSSAELWELIAN